MLSKLHYIAKTAFLAVISAILWPGSDVSAQTSVTDARGFTWHAAPEGGLMRSDGYDTLAYSTPHADSLPLTHRHITELQTDAAGRIWMLADNEYLILNPADGTVHPLADDFDRLGLPQMPAIVRLAGDDTWFVVSGGGVYRLSPGKSTFKMPDKGLSERNITDLLLLPARNTAFAIDNLSHIYIFDYNTGWVLSHSQNPLAPSAPAPYSLALLADSSAVAVTSPGTHLSYIYSPSGNRWANSSDTTPALSPPPSSLKAPRILLAGIDFHNPASPACVVEPEYASSVTVPARDASFTIRFALAGSPSGSVAYTYQLIGFDRHPVAIPRDARSATFANLPPGRYTLAIRATDTTDSSITAIRNLPIVITGPWWSTSAARAVFILLAVVLLGVLLHLTRLHERRRWHAILGPCPAAAPAEDVSTSVHPVAVPGAATPTTAPSLPDISSSPRNTVLVVGDLSAIPPLAPQLHTAVVSNSAGAIAALSASSPISIVLISPSVPLVSASVLTRLIRSNRATVATPVVILTSHTDTLLTEGLTLCADATINLPDNLRLVTATISGLLQLSRNGLRRQAATPPAPNIRITPSDCALIHNAVRHISESISRTDLTVEHLARELRISRIHLYNRISAVTGKTPVEFIRLVRLRRAATMLRQTQKSPADIATELGFSNPKNFMKYFREEYSLTPHDYRFIHQSESPAQSDVP